MSNFNRGTISLYLFFLSLVWTGMVHAQKADFTAPVTAGCSPLVVNFQDQSTGNIKSWSWDLGNGATSTLQNPSTTYFKAGTYSVSLTVTSTNGSNSITKNQFITIYGKPIIDFTVSDTAGCFPVRSQFTDLSGASPGTTNANWLWDFGDGTQSTQKNPLNVYRAAGTYSITLKLTNDKGCYSVLSKTALIKVVGGVNSDFSNTAPVVCSPPFNINFTNKGTGPGTLTYLWDFGDGTTSTIVNPSHSYTKTGNFNVSLTTTSSNGCSDTLQKTNALIFQNIKPIINGPDSICVFTPAAFSDSANPAPLNSFWQFGDNSTSNQNNPVKAYLTPGTYTIKLINTYSYCSDSVTKNIKIISRPVAAFTADDTAKCKPSLTVSFTDQSINAVNWLWKFGDGSTSTQKNPVHTYSNYGDYDVKLLVTNASGCTDSLLKPAFIKIDNPVITFNGLPTEGCIPFSTNLSANIKTVDKVTSYLWDFGDGSPKSNFATPPHTYSVQGSYPVTLIITTSTGCTDTSSLGDAIKVGTHPTVDFTALPNPACALQNVQFTDASSATPNGINKWHWDFGGNLISNVQNPIVMFSDTGKVNVKLVVTNNGCQDSLIRTNYINIQPPIAKFFYKIDCSNRLLIAFTDSSIIDISKGVTYSWDFGDGSTATVKNPSHTYASLGVYNISLTVTNGTCSNTKTIPLTLFQEHAAFIADKTTACRPAGINFTVQNYNRNTVSYYLWDFGDGTMVQNLAQVSGLIYQRAGNYTVKLKLVDIFGCTDSTFRTDYIHITGPTANFSSNNASGCKGLNVVFNDLTQTDGISKITKWQWDFGDGSTQTFSSPPFQHTYTAVGLYSVKLTVTDANGCSDNIQIKDFIHTTIAKALFTTDSLACPGSTVNFSNLSTGSNFTSQWNFGNTTTSTQTSPSTSYATTGIYDVTLKIIDQFGCADSLTRPKYIKVAKPVASFTVSDSVSSCIPLEVDFTNTSQYTTSILWNLNGIFTTLSNPVQYYVSVGSYPIQLIATSPGGCIDSVNKTIRVYDTAGAKITYNPLSGCTPLNVDLVGFSPGPLTYTWDFGDGALVTNNLTSLTHVYHAFGTFIPKIIMTDHSGCVIPVTGIDTIQIIGAVPKFGLDKRLLCDSGLVNFIDSTTFNDPILSYNWSFGDGDSSHLSQPTHNYAGQGFYTVWLNVQTQSGCTDTFQRENVIKIVNSPLFSITGDSVVCAMGFLHDQGIFNRIDTSAVIWSWHFPNGATSDLQNPSNQQYNTPGNYTISSVVTNSSGCETDQFKNIYINPLPVITMPPSIIKIAGTPVTIPATYSSNVVSYNWQPVTDLSCIDCPQPVATNKFNTKYLVSVVDSNGCKNNSEIEIIVTCKNANVFVPNTFSPNGDGINDVFYVRGKGLERVKSLRIFNRWGQVVFERSDFQVNDPAFGWNGKFKGSQPIPDVYIYQLEVFCENSEIIQFEGNVALIK